MQQIRNISPFVREVEETKFGNTAMPEHTIVYREWRPLVIALLLGALVGFCVWLYIVVQVGAIGLK